MHSGIGRRPKAERKEPKRNAYSTTASPTPQSARYAEKPRPTRSAMHLVEQVEDYIDAREVHFELVGKRAD
jgi:hypothetical protein